MDARLISPWAYNQSERLAAAERSDTFTPSLTIALEMITRVAQVSHRDNRSYRVSSRFVWPRTRPGESHVRGAKLLRWKRNLILTMSPDSRGDCFGPFC